MSSAKTTTDHDSIRKWAKERGGHPARVRETASKKGAGGILRIDFGKPEDALERISWDGFFKTFDKREACISLSGRERRPLRQVRQPRLRRRRPAG